MDRGNPVTDLKVRWAIWKRASFSIFGNNIINLNTCPLALVRLDMERKFIIDNQSGRHQNNQRRNYEKKKTGVHDYIRG